MGAVVVRRRTRIPEWKLREVEELVKLIKSHKVIALAKLENLPTPQLQKIRKKLGDRMIIRVAKNTLFKIALDKTNIPGKEELTKYLEGPNLFIFTNMNPFELSLLLEKEKIPAAAKPGMKATTEIVVPAGNTGLTPGPILSTFGKLKIPTRIQDGTIWIARDVVVAKPGDEISSELASLLQRLGIEPFEIGIELKVVYDEGLLIPAEKLKLDLNEYKSDFSEAHLKALGFAAEIAWPIPEAIEMAIWRAYRRALEVMAETGFVTPETFDYVVQKAIARANALILAMGDKAKELGLEAAPVAAPVEAPAAKEEEKKEEEKEEEEKGVSEEEIAAGLGALFG